MGVAGLLPPAAGYSTMRCTPTHGPALVVGLFAVRPASRYGLRDLGRREPGEQQGEVVAVRLAQGEPQDDVVAARDQPCARIGVLDRDLLDIHRVRPMSPWENSGMAVIGEITELLRRWNVWKRVEGAPERIDALERRVAELEAKLASRPLAEACPICETGEMKVKAVKAHPTFGVTLQCNACGHSEEQMHDPTSRTGRK
jgi:hypothetical protein